MPAATRHLRASEIPCNCSCSPLARTLVCAVGMALCASPQHAHAYRRRDPKLSELPRFVRDHLEEFLLRTEAHFEKPPLCPIGSVSQVASTVLQARSAGLCEFRRRPTPPLDYTYSK
jgi:hypothetical protein